MLSTILSVFCKHRPVRLQATLVISYYKRVDIKGTAPGVGRGKELSLSVEDGVHPNPSVEAPHLDTPKGATPPTDWLVFLAGPTYL